MKPKHSSGAPSLAGFDPKPVDLGWKRILVPLDFTDSSVTALNYAIPLALRSGGKLVLLHVVQFPTMPTPAVTGGALGQVKDAHKALTLEAKSRLEEIARETCAPGLVIHQAVTVGVAWDEIVKAAKRLECDLVVISSHGHTGLLRMLASNTAEHVVRAATCPVLCVRG